MKSFTYSFLVSSYCWRLAGCVQLLGSNTGYLYPRFLLARAAKRLVGPWRKIFVSPHHAWHPAAAPLARGAQAGVPRHQGGRQLCSLSPFPWGWRSARSTQLPTRLGGTIGDLENYPGEGKQDRWASERMNRDSQWEQSQADWLPIFPFVGPLLLPWATSGSTWPKRWVWAAPVLLRSEEGEGRGWKAATPSVPLG